MEKLIAILEIFEQSNLVKMKVELEDIKVEMEKATQAVVPVALPQPILTTNCDIEEAVEGEVVCSPLVGIFYASPSPEAKPFIEVGSKVTKGQIICIVEAMKVMNELTAPCDGTVSAIYVNNQEQVGYKQPIMVIK